MSRNETPALLNELTNIEELEQRIAPDGGETVLPLGVAGGLDS